MREVNLNLPSYEDHYMHESFPIKNEHARKRVKKEVYGEAPANIASALKSYEEGKRSILQREPIVSVQPQATSVLSAKPEMHLTVDQACDKAFAEHADLLSILD